MQPWVLAGLVVFAGAVLQGVAAFGVALFSVPLMLQIGGPLPIVLAGTAPWTVLLTGMGAHHLRRSVPWREVGLSVPFRAAGMIGGILTLRAMASAPVAAIRFWVGGVILLLVFALSVGRLAPRPR